MNYKPGQIVALGHKDIKYQLLHYKGEYRNLSNGARVFQLTEKQVIQNEGRTHAYYEVWACLNLNNGKSETKKLPVYIFQESPDDYIETDRRDVIDDNNEVSSLLDEYSCWNTGERSNHNFHLNIINKRHQDQIAKLKSLELSTDSIDFKTGIRLKLIQKEHPNTLTRRMFREWGIEFPDLLTKLKDYVYMSSNIANNINDTDV